VYESFPFVDLDVSRVIYNTSPNRDVHLVLSNEQAQDYSRFHSY
jgi:hypothetical protein